HCRVTSMPARRHSSAQLFLTEKAGPVFGADAWAAWSSCDVYYPRSSWLTIGLTMFAPCCAPSPAVLATYRAAGDALGVLLRLHAREPRVWDLSAILPDRSAC